MLSLTSNAQLFTFRNFNYKNGLPIASITSIFPHKDGSIYLGTDGTGIYKFDGESFEELRGTTDGNHHITSISVGEDAFYFASKYRGIYELKDNRTTLISSRRNVKGDWLRVYSFNKSLFFANSRTFYIRDKLGQKKLAGFAENIVIYQIVPLKRGFLILSSKGNYYYDPKWRNLKLISNWYEKKGSLSQMNFGFRTGDRLVLYDRFLSKRIEIVLTDGDKVFSYKERQLPKLLNDKVEVKSLTHNAVVGKTYFMTIDDKLLVSNGISISPVEANYERPMRNCNAIRADVNGNIWCTSSSNGLYKISLEPFTRILTHAAFHKPDIYAITKANGDLLFSAMSGKTYLSRFKDSKLEEFDFVTNYFTQDEQYFWLATKTGIKRIDKESYQLTNFSLPEVDGNDVMLLALTKNDLYVGLYGKGLLKYNLSSRKLQRLKSTSPPPLYFYTFQHSQILQKNYFGTNNKLWEEDLKTGEFHLLPNLDDVGYFSGVSTKDSYGNLWFTTDNCLVGILKNGELVKIDNKNYFNSTLFYTLNSDSYGNLILGTNKGLTILNVDEFGAVLSVNFYTSQNGFDGYETNMRGQFQDGKEIFVGTVEGIFSIDTRMLMNLKKPTKPIVKELYHQYDNQPNSLHAFKISTNNPRVKNIRYCYRIIGKDNQWSSPVYNPIIYIDDLENGTYALEAKSTYDGKVFSDTSHYEFQVKQSIWRTKWLVILMVVLILAIALYAISRRKTLEGANFFDTSDILVELKFAPSILLVSFLTNFGVNLFAPTVDPTLPNLLLITMPASFIMLISYLLSKLAQAAGRSDWMRILLNLTFSTFILQSYLNIYFSDMHFLYVTALAMINTVAPYIYKKFMDVVIHNLIIVLVSILFFVYIDNTNFSKYILLSTLLISAALSIFLTYLRFDSLEKLSFISGIVNQGNVPVIVFNRLGNMTFVSENVKDFLPVTREELINKKVSFLNHFLQEGDKLRAVDFTKKFTDNAKYVARMLSNRNETIWLEWTCKVFADNINCIIGQDVTDRVQAESTYELLVESAEDLIYHTDINGNINFSNERFNQFFGYNQQKEGSGSSLKYIHPDYREKVWEFYGQHFKERKSSSYFQFQVIDANGNVRWLGQHVSSRIDPHNPKHIIGFLVVARDITKNLENEQLILEQHREITSSIQYSKQIQQTLLTSREYINQLFEENFLIFRPKDIVSGDFYWFHRAENKVFFALGDCTGHGVPGAFMTLLGINLLNNIIIENHYQIPAQILNEMDRRLVDKLFKQNENSINDGIEMTIVCIDVDTNSMAFACAGSRFLIYKDDDFTLYKGDNKHVGDFQEGFTEYFNHHVQLEENDVVYFFTDGFQDQFGGVHNKRFSFRRLLESIEANSLLPLVDQKKLIEEEFDTWKSDFEQTDDVTVFAFRGIKP